jgi:single-strand DNA-binding protein
MSNNISVLGRLGRDGEGKNISGTALFEFSIAEDVGFGDRKTTNWWKVQLWGKQAESKVVDYLTKGQQVLVFGEVTMREWTDKEGNKRLSPEVRASSIQLAGSKSDGAMPRNPGQSDGQKPANLMTKDEKWEAAASRASQPQPVDPVDDIPF